MREHWRAGLDELRKYGLSGEVVPARGTGPSGLTIERRTFQNGRD